MKERVPPTVDGLVSAALRDEPSLSTLSRVADDVVAHLPPPGASTRSLIRPRMAAIVAVSAVGLGVFAMTQMFDEKGTSLVTSSKSEPLVHEEPATTSALEVEPSVREPVSEATKIPTTDIHALPDSKRPPEVRKGSPDSVKASPGEEMSEGALLQRAHAAISSDQAQALAFAAEHARRFPNGVLVEEREVIAIEALVRLERMAEARGRAERFFSTFAGSAYRQRVDDALDAAARTHASEGTP